MSFVAGRFAYKIKKSCDLGFVDFIRMAARQHDCNENLRLSPRPACGLYLGAAFGVRLGRICKTGAQGQPVGHSARMKSFDEGELFYHLLARRTGFRADRPAGRTPTPIFRPLISTGRVVMRRLATSGP